MSFTKFSFFFLFFCCYFVAQIFQATKVTKNSILIWQEKRKLFLSGKTFEKKKKKGLNPQMDSAQIVIFVFTTK